MAVQCYYVDEQEEEDEVLPEEYYHVDEQEELASLMALLEVDDGVYRSMEEEFRTLLRKAAELDGVEALSPYDELAWAQWVEEDVWYKAQPMAEQVEGIWRGAAVLALRPGEEAAVEALQRRAALLAARLEQGDEVAAAMRRLQEKNFRSLAARPRDRLDDEACRLLRTVTPASLLEGPLQTAEELGNVEATVMRVEWRMYELALTLRHGAAELAARPGEEALVAALERHASNAEAMRTALQALIATLCQAKFRTV